MQFTKAGKAALVATALITLSPVAASAAAPTTTTRTTTQDEGSDFPWGLLGLLGLAGLLGMRKKESDIHVDNRRNP